MRSEGRSRTISLIIVLAVIASSALAVVVCIVGIAPWPFPYYRTTAIAMSPNINPGDIFFANRFAYTADHGPQAGDVIVFSGPTFSTAPGAPNAAGVKRVVAVPGDSLSMRDGILRRNGKPVSEPPLGSRAPYRLEIRNFAIYVDGRPLDARSGVFMPPAARWSAPDRVPSGCYVVLGDNRANAVDSHVVGFVCPGLPTTVDMVAPVIVGRVFMPPIFHVESGPTR